MPGKRGKIAVVNEFWPLVRAMGLELEKLGYEVSKLALLDAVDLYKDPRRSGNLFLLLIGDGGLSRDDLEFIKSTRGEGVHPIIPLVLVGGFNLLTKKGDLYTSGVDQILPADMHVTEALAAITPFLRQRRAMIGMATLNRKLKELSMTDDLTGLPNRRWFNRDLKRGFEMTRRLKAPLSIVMMDMDDFKEINDRYGHQAGDMLLAQFGNLMNRIRRAYDIVARLGGDEFGWILFNTDSKRAHDVALRARKIVSKHPFSIKDHQINVTSSFGIATFDGTGHKDHESLLEEADRALYRAKESGKNGVITFGIRRRPVEDGNIEIS